ncbi:hypothetical protein V6N12_016018 [Hibiscus sabdariffa]|uniref:Uncharacterized protein n=1 Tax=Hibiscus sabdariffa TaxID=183260 RepID=A0ABR2ARF1_9ROSI
MHFHIFLTRNGWERKCSFVLGYSWEQIQWRRGDETYHLRVSKVELSGLAIECGCDVEDDTSSDSHVSNTLDDKDSSVSGSDVIRVT